MTAKNIENLIKNSQFPDPDCKSRLRKQLFENDTRLKNQEAFSEKDCEEISMDELDAVAGGRD